VKGLTDVAGIRVGHATDLDAGTGCTVVLCPPDTVAAVDQRGGAPGTRETDLLKPGRLVEHVHAVVLSGGSAFGLASADGVARYLAEQGVGHPTNVGVVPIVPTAILFDLAVGRADVQPDARMGRLAAEGATADAVVQGCVGAGTGASIGGRLGAARGCKGGIGTASAEVGGATVAALFAVNALGDVLDPDGTVLAGCRTEDGRGFVGPNVLPGGTLNPFENTVIGIVATDAAVGRAHLQHVCAMAHDGLARAVKPAHTLFDGDTIFGLATGTAGTHDLTTLGALAADVTAKAIRNAARAATTLHGLPGFGAVR
jgi:L-aminopeptidase/D-esterase-like protein